VSERQAAPASILDYLAELSRWRFPPATRLDGPVTDRLPGWRGVVQRAVPHRALSAARVVATRVWMASGRADTLDRGDQPLRLHLGCGERRLPGWRNIDLVGAGADFPWDLRRPLPVRAGSVQAVFHEHLLEHLPLPAGVALLRASHELLAPGGVLRVGVPDAERYLVDYVERRGVLETLRPERPTPMTAINELAYLYGHASMWDAETLCLVLAELGFAEVRPRPSGESALDPVPDWPAHEAETLYVEAVRA
jgi:predicted SAM-dependent methyltransferase